MVRMILTDNSEPCFDNSHLLSSDFLRSVKTATRKTLYETSDLATGLHSDLQYWD